MARRTPEDVYSALIRAGFSPQQAQTMTAIAGAESSWNDTAIGDTGLQDATWGPSVGALQIRTLKKDTGTGSDRDITRLMGDLDAQAAAAWDISKHGTDLTPWSTYNDNKYKGFLGQVAGAIAGIPGAIAGKAGQVAGDVAGAAAGVVVDAAKGALGGLRTIGLESLAAAAGLALIGAGLVAMLMPRIRQAKQMAAEAL